jgi:hypothetical protein
MEIADKAAAFLSQVAPVVKDAANNSMSQMSAAMRHASGPVRGFVGQVGTQVGTVLAGKPAAEVTSHQVPNMYQTVSEQYKQYVGSKKGNPATVAAPYMSIPPYNPAVGPAEAGSINTLGGMLNQNFPRTASTVQRMMASPVGTQALGAGAIGAGVLGAGAAAAGAAAYMNNRKKKRMAGQDLGAQLGVGMPSA